MFDSLKNAIEVAETVERLFKFEKETCVSNLAEYNGRNDLEMWEARCKEQYANEIELLDEIEKLIQKWVKNKM